MTPDEVVKVLEHRLEYLKRVTPQVHTTTLFRDLQKISKENLLKLDEDEIQSLSSAISLIQDYQKLGERVSVEKIQKILAWELSLLGKPMNDGSVLKIAQAIVTYLGGER